MSPTPLIAHALGVAKEEVVCLKNVASESRNEIWRCEIEGWERAVYLKTQGGERFSRSVAEEAEVLGVLCEAPFSLAPRLLARGSIDTGASYLLCEECAGTPLHDHLAEISPEILASLFEQIIGAIQRLQSNDRLRHVLGKRNYVGVYRPDFDPVENAQKLCAERAGVLDQAPRREMSAVLERCSEEKTSASPEILHGSLSPHNLLIDVSEGSTDPDALTGVLDFEATRLGPLAYDVASLAFWLFMEDRVASMKQWLSVCAGKLRTRRLVAQAIPFIAYFYLMRRKKDVGSLPPASGFGGLLSDVCFEFVRSSSS